MISRETPVGALIHYAQPVLHDERAERNDADEQKNQDTAKVRRGPIYRAQGGQGSPRQERPSIMSGFSCQWA